MTRKTPSDFNSHDDWLAYVRSEVPSRGAALRASLRPHGTLSKLLPDAGNLSSQAQFAEELERIEMLHDPERTAALEALNDEIFRSLTRQLFDGARPTNLRK